jgi:phosphoribosyl-AMP cyclohydrolase
MVTTREIVERVKFNADGLVPVIAQDADSHDVLMLAWMNSAALQLTLETGQATYFSRSRNELWIKGETSGNRQRVRQLSLDCDDDTVLLAVEQTGPACHTGTPSCFSDRVVYPGRELGDG